jgi:hypothetical protein
MPAGRPADNSFGVAARASVGGDRVVRWLGWVIVVALVQPAAAGDERAMRDEFSLAATHALAAAEQVDDADMRVTLLSRIATAQARAGDRDAARATLAHADEVARKVPDPDAGWIGRAHSSLYPHSAAALRLYRDIVHDKLALTHLAMGDFAGALDAARRIRTGAHRRVRVLLAIAQAQRRAGAPADASPTLRLAADGVPRDPSMLAGIAREQALAGDTETARRTIARAKAGVPALEQDHERNSARGSIADAQAAIGDFAAAFETLRDNAASWLFAADLARVAIRQARHGLDDAARKTLLQADRAAREVEDTVLRANAMEFVVKAQLEAGAAPEALATARAMPPITTHRARALADVAREFIRRGDLGTAELAVRDLPPRETYGAVNALVLARAARREFPDALATARLAHGTGHRIGLLAAVAAEQARTGQQEAAASTLATALATAQTMEPGDHRVEALAHVAAGMAREDEPAAAAVFARLMEEASAINVPAWRADVLRRVMHVFAEAGARDWARSAGARAVQTANAMADDHDRDSTLRDVAQSLATDGEIRLALAAAQGRRLPYSRADSLAAVAESAAGARR